MKEVTPTTSSLTQMPRRISDEPPLSSNIKFIINDTKIKVRMEGNIDNKCSYAI